MPDIEDVLADREPSDLLWMRNQIFTLFEEAVECADDALAKDDLDPYQRGYHTAQRATAKQFRDAVEEMIRLRTAGRLGGAGRG